MYCQLNISLHRLIIIRNCLKYKILYNPLPFLYAFFKPLTCHVVIDTRHIFPQFSRFRRKSCTQYFTQYVKLGFGDGELPIEVLVTDSLDCDSLRVYPSKIQQYRRSHGSKGDFIKQQTHIIWFGAHPSRRVSCTMPQFFVTNADSSSCIPLENILKSIIRKISALGGTQKVCSPNICRPR